MHNTLEDSGSKIRPTISLNLRQIIIRGKETSHGIDHSASTNVPERDSLRETFSNIEEGQKIFITLLSLWERPNSQSLPS